MIGTALYLLCATAIAHAYEDLDDTDVEDFYDNGCPKDNTIEKLLPSEDCSRYFQCFRGELIPRLCPHGLSFNADLEKCAWYGNADCHNKRDDDKKTAVEELDKNNPKHAALICSAPNSKGVLVTHKNCNEFYKCLNGKPMVVQCAEGLMYNTRTEQCDSDVDCGFRTLSSKDNIIKALSICSSKFSDGIEVAHDSCDKFYKCSGGVAVTITCPINHFYDPSTEYCDLARNVDCEGRTIPENVDGKHSTVIVGKNNDEEENNIIGGDDQLDAATIICGGFNSDGVLVSHAICNHFYKCLEKKPVAFYCPGDLLFNSEKYYCDWPSNVHCGDRIIPNDIGREEIIDDSTPTLSCSAANSDGLLIAHPFCNKFYKCHDGVPVEVKCPGILLYNLKTKGCDWPAHVYCKDRTVPKIGWSRKEDDEESASENVDENNINSGSEYGNQQKFKIKIKRNDLEIKSNVLDGSPSKICVAADYDGRSLPHENCNQYYKCIQGTPIALFCDLNYYYQPKKGYCDLAKYVNCTGRTVPRFIG